MTAQIVDNDFALYSQGYQLARVCRLDSGHTVRLRVKRDSYKQQSHAVAEVLNGDLKWTDLVSESAESWWPGSPHLTSVFKPDEHKNRKGEALLGEIADRLLARATAVLAA